MFRSLIGGLVLATVTGCAYPWSRNHTMEPEAFARDRYACLWETRGYQVWGSAMYVMMNQNRYFLPCMQTRGWYLPRAQ